MDEIKIDEVLEFYKRVLGNVPMPWKGLQPRSTAEIAASPLSRGRFLRPKKPGRKNVTR
jgi:hypothetical protein